MNEGLTHRQQPEPYGCIYYSAFAITGDESLLEHARDVSPYRYTARMAERGWAVGTVFNDLWRRRATPDFWEELTGSVVNGAGCFLLDVDSQRFPGLHHKVALLFPEDPNVYHWVSDSTLPEMIPFRDRAAFLASHYAGAWEVTYLQSLKLDDHPHEDALERMARDLAAVKEAPRE